MNLKLNENQGFQNRFNVSDGDDFEVLVLGANDKTKVIVWYTGSSAITEADLVSFPKGTIVFDEQASKIKMKTTAEGSTNFVDATLT